MKRTPEIIAKWRKSMGDMKSVRNRLNDGQVVLVCKLLAMFKNRVEIANILQQKYNVKINPNSLSYYLEHPSYRALIQKNREEFVQGCGDIAIFHKRVRLGILGDQLQEVRSGLNSKKRVRNRSEEREILDNARVECEPFEKQEAVNLVQNNSLLIQLNSMDEKSLLKRRDEILEEISRLGGKKPKKEVLNGQTSRLSEGTWVARSDSGERIQDDPSGGGWKGENGS